MKAADRSQNAETPIGAIVAMVLFLLLSGVLMAVGEANLPTVHTILDTCMFLLGAILALLFWDMGVRLDRPFNKWLAVSFIATSILEFIHVFVSEGWGYSPGIQLGADLRAVTWPPVALILPIGIGGALWMASRRARGVGWFAIAIAFTSAVLLAIYALVEAYMPAGVLGITRPSLIAAPFLWATVSFACWKLRAEDRIVSTLGVVSVTAMLASIAMLYARAPHDVMSIIAHFGSAVGYLALLSALIRMASRDMADLVVAEAQLARSNDELEERVLQRTNALRAEMDVRLLAENTAHAWLERLSLLHEITRAIAERQDLNSIFQVVVRSVEEQLVVDFACLCTYDAADSALKVACVGVRSADLALDLAMSERSRIEIDGNGLSRCVAGRLVYEPNVQTLQFPFPQRLAVGGLGCFVAAPLQVDNRVFGALIVARTALDGFSISDCEFLHQLSDHVALAANQAQLNDTLQQAYDDLRTSQEAVLQQERLRALGQMASGVAHDINNALSPIALYTESLLATEPHLTVTGRSKLEIVQRAIDDAAHTVSRMKAFYYNSDTPVEMTFVRPEILIQQVLDLTQARWRDIPQQRGVVIEMRTQFTADLPPIFSVESELRDALINLVFNAVDALPQGGVVTIRTKQSRDLGLVQIEVEDNGVGMDEATQQRCLEPFFTTKGERGTGLGLAMVYGAMQRHGADVCIESVLGQGTIIRITFPANPADTATAKAIAFDTMPRSGLKLLLVDDDPIMLRSLRDVLASDGHLISIATGGSAGIALFQAALVSVLPFDAVITDLGMPRIDGRRVASTIKSASPETPVILLTGWGARIKLEDERIAHVDRVLSKPPKIRDIRLALAECCGPAAAGDANELLRSKESGVGSTDTVQIESA